MAEGDDAGKVYEVPASLLAPSVQELWVEVRRRLDRYGPDHRARMRLGPVDPETGRVLRSLLNSSSTTVDLGQLERALVERGVGSDLDEAVAALGYPPSPTATERRAARARSERVRDAVLTAVDEWPEVWARDWADEVLAGGTLAGLSALEAEAAVADVRRLIDLLDGVDGNSDAHGGGRAAGAGPGGGPLVRNRSGRWSRVDVAAYLYGSAHGLDSQSLRERLCRRALVHRGPPGDLGDDGGAVWEAAGFHLDRVSEPVLTWGLDLGDGSELDSLARAATAAGVALPITTMALEGWRPSATFCATAGPVLVVENPRVVEAAADLRVGFAVVTTNGNPRRNVVDLVGRLIDGGAEVYYHGDFDAAGLAICGRMAAAGCRPYAMADGDYAEACDRAGRRGLALPVDPNQAGPTPWSPALQQTFNVDRGRRVVHEEFVIHTVLAFDPML